jgi:predicted transcriptional regulator
MSTALKIISDQIQCRECGFKSHSILDHLREAHGMSVPNYLQRHPGAATVSHSAMKAWEDENRRGRRAAAPKIENLHHEVYGVATPVNRWVPLEACGVKPRGYKYPSRGMAADAMAEVIECLHEGTPVFFYGPPGTGKDVAFSSWSQDTRTPLMKVSFTPDTHVKAYGTGWEFGLLWSALTEGVVGRDGSRHPALIVFSDVDRATSGQLEELRLMLDTDDKSVIGPTGGRAALFPGTMFGFTANSNGSGDHTGRFSSNVMDASITDRMGEFVRAHYMDWAEEEKILRSKFPLLNEEHPQMFAELGDCVKSLREAIDGSHTQYELDGQLTHRGLMVILNRAERKTRLGKKVTLGRAFEAWLQRLDEDNQLIARRLIDPHCTGGAFGKKE